MQKSEIRKEIGERLKGYGLPYFERASSEIQKKILKYIMGSSIKIIFCYVSTLSEVSTMWILKQLLDTRKQVLVPKITDGQMKAVTITTFDDLRDGKFGILEPIHNHVYVGNIDVCITPGVAFTKSGKRIGKGQGCYDNFFSHFSVKNKIGICYDFQILDDFEVEVHDVDMDIVITNS